MSSPSLAAQPVRRLRMTHVARSSLLIAGFFALDKALGLVRQVVIGRQFGISRELDAFNAANNLPDLLFALISGGALAIAFIPVLSEALDLSGRQAAWSLFSRVANWAFSLTASLALLIAVFAKPLVKAEFGIAPGFTPELQLLVIGLMRLDLIATLIFSLSGLVIAGLQANQHFLLPALAPVLYDIGQIFGAVVLAPDQGYQVAGVSLPAGGMGIHGLAYGVILGAALHLAVQIPGLIRYKFHWTPRLGWHDPRLRKVARLMGPRILTIGAFQLIFVLQDNLASRLDVGSVTALAYGWLIMQVPETIIGTAIGTAILPTLSEFFARDDGPAFEAAVARAVRGLLAITLPAAAVLMVTLRPLIQSAFQFDPRGTELVVWAARAYLLGLMGHSVLEVAARAFYARQDARTPLLTAALSTTTFFICALLLFRPLAAAGIGLANSLAFTLEAGVLILLLARRFPGVLRHGSAPARSLLAGAAAAAIGYLGVTYLPGPNLIAGPAAMALGGLAAVPFILPELHGLIRL
jgi:putative peptidoglycan lipid II flippase